MKIRNPDLRNDESQKNIILSARAAYAREHDNSVIICLSFVLMNRSMEDNVICDTTIRNSRFRILVILKLFDGGE